MKEYAEYLERYAKAHQITKEVAAEYMICKNVKAYYEDLENERNKNIPKSNSDTDIQCTDICPSGNNKLFDGRIEKRGCCDVKTKEIPTK